ncbi:MAG: glycosyltransferase family 4 protein [Flavitalea sp.]
MHNLTKIKVFRILLIITYPISLLFIYPFVFFSGRKKYKLFFFFDRYAIGGAQRVHLDILDSVADICKKVFFTRVSPNDKLKNEFYSKPLTDCEDVHIWCDYLFFRLFSIHYFAFIINRNSKAKVLSANSTFFYDMLPFLNKKITRIELLHNFSFGKNGMEFFGLANRKYLNYRLVIDIVTRNNIIDQYKQYNAPALFNDKIMVIEFGVNIPTQTIKSRVPALRILYAGRGTPQKRIWLLNKIAEHFVGRKEISFVFAGSMTNELSDVVKSTYLVHKEIGSKEVMNQLYRDAHIVILTSAFEGFPLVVKEGMAYGCVPLVTSLPGIRTHIFQLENGILIDPSDNEEMVVSKSIEAIELLLKDDSLLQQLSHNAYMYATAHFSRKPFLAAYRRLLESTTV